MSDDAIAGHGATITPDTEKRRRSGDVDDEGSAWLSQHEQRVIDLLTTLGTVGHVRLQSTIKSKFGMTIGHQPLETFLDRFYGKTGRPGAAWSSHEAATAVTMAPMHSDEVMKAEPIDADLRKLFVLTSRTIGDLQKLLERFAIVMAYPSSINLYVRTQWELEADNEFSMAMGMDTALPTQN